MDPDEIKQRIDEADAKLRAKLAELGFTPEEIERQLDRAIPDEQKKAEREKVLARKFVAELNDPSSGLLDKIIDRAAGELETKLAAEEAARRKRRVNLIVGAAIAAAVIGIGVWYFALRDTRTSCEKLVGPLAELEQLTGTKLEMRSGHETDYSCYQYVDRAGHAGGFTVWVETARGDAFDAWMANEANRKFADKTTFVTALGEVTLFIAGDASNISSEELLADAQANVGKTNDPMGAALAKLPPSQHVALLRMANKTLKVSLDRELFSVDKAKSYVTSVAQRAR